MTLNRAPQRGNRNLDDVTIPVPPGATCCTGWGRPVPVGWFSQPARAWGVWAPAMGGTPDDLAATRQQVAAGRAARAKALQTGKGWGRNSIVFPGTPKDLGPMPMAKPGTAARRKGA